MKLIFSILFFLFTAFWTNAQSEMLIDQFSGRMVTRESFDKSGKLLNKQTFKAEKTKKFNNTYEIKVVTKLYDKDGKLTDSYNTNYTCKPGDASVVVLALPFSNVKSKKTKINTKSTNFKDLYDLNNLENIEIQINFDSGLLNFFGSKSNISIFNRTVKRESNNKVVTSKMKVKAYALGVKIKQFDYKVTEKLHKNNRLYFQKFTENDGSYFTMTYK